MKRWLVIAAAALASGCSYSDLREAWIGQPADMLIYQWGPPTAVVDTAYGRTFTYDHTHAVDGNSYDCTATVQADTSDRVAQIRLEGNVGGCNRLMLSKNPPA